MFDAFGQVLLTRPPLKRGAGAVGRRGRLGAACALMRAGGTQTDTTSTSTRRISSRPNLGASRAEIAPCARRAARTL